MDAVKEWVQKALERVEPSPEALAQTFSRIRRRSRQRRIGGGTVGLLLLIALSVGLWSVLASGGHPAVRRPSATKPAPSDALRLFLAGDHELWVVDVASSSVERLIVPQLSPGDPPYRIVRRGSRLVLMGGTTYVLDPASSLVPRALAQESSMFIPSTYPDRVWIGIEGAPGQLSAVREVTLDGQVTVADVQPPAELMPVASLESGLVFQTSDGRLEVWDPATNQVIREFPGVFPVASYQNTLAWCASTCDSMRITDLASGRDVTVNPPSSTYGFDAYRGSFSPDGTTIAVPVRTDSDPTSLQWKLALVDVATGAVTLVNGTDTQGPYAYVDWSPTGAEVFMSGEDASGTRTISEFRRGAQGASQLPIHVGDFYGMAAD